MQKERAVTVANERRLIVSALGFVCGQQKKMDEKNREERVC